MIVNERLKDKGRAMRLTCVEVEHVGLLIENLITPEIPDQ